jgi:hypothetical protein
MRVETEFWNKGNPPNEEVETCEPMTINHFGRHFTWKADDDDLAGVME